MNRTYEEAVRLAREDFRVASQFTLHTHVIRGYSGPNHEPDFIHLVDPVRVKVTGLDLTDCDRMWLDPTWSVELVDDVPELDYLSDLHLWPRAYQFGVGCEFDRGDYEFRPKLEVVT